MSKFLQIIYFLILALSISIACKDETTSPKIEEQDTVDSTSIEGWNLVWNDEFDYEGSADPEKWDYDIWARGRVNNEEQNYTADSINSRVTNGKLTIEAHYYPTLPEEVQYTSARLVTRGKGDWKYGRIDVKAKLPKGRGTWPAIWMLPTDWVYGGWPASGEIDIMEHVGYDENRVHGTVHTDAYNHTKGTQKGGSINIPTATSQYHIYSIEWNAEKIRFFVDGENYYTFFNSSDGDDKEWPFDQRFHVILNLAIGGNWGGAQGIDTSIFPVQFHIDYVRVYKKAE